MTIVDVLIIFEHVNRELESALLIKRKLEIQNLKVVVVQSGWDEGLSYLKYAPKLIIAPWCYDNRNYFHLCKYKGGLPNNRLKILNLHCEQLTYDAGNGFLLPENYAKEVYHIAWGQYFKELLMECGVNEKKICVAGSSRLDFFRREFCNINYSKKELGIRFNLNTDRKWILLVGNFACAYWSEHTIHEFEKRHFKNIRQQVLLSKRTFWTIAEWYTYLCEQLSGNETFELIYRPHPGEGDSKQLLKLSQKYKNFHIIGELAIRDWLINSDAAFIWNSTSSVEAVFAGTPVWALRPIVIPNELKVSLIENIPQISSKEEFVEQILQVATCDLSTHNKKFASYISYYYRNAEKSAIDMTIDYIRQILNEETESFNGNRKILLYGLRKALAYYIKISLLYLGILPRIPRYFVLCKDHLSKKDMKAEIERIDKINII